MRKVLLVGVVAAALFGLIGLPCVAATDVAAKAGASGGSAGGGAKAGNALLKEVEQAYRHLDQYQAKVRITIDLKQGRWTVRRQGAATIAYDRGNKRLKIDAPEMLVVVNDGKLRMTSTHLPGQRLEVAAPEPLTYQGLAEAVGPAMGSPPMADVAMLLAAHPMQALSHDQTDSATRVTLKDGGVGLRFHDPVATVTLAIDPSTHLVSGSTVQFSQAALAGQGADSLVIRRDYEVQKRNEPLAADVFAFDTTSSTPASSVQQMIQNAQAQASEANGGDARQMVGQAAPRVRLTTLKGKSFDSKNVKAKVLVLDFWATWCGPCVREGLPLLQDTYEWAHKNHKDVAIYAVNGGETAGTVRQFWSQERYDMPVLLDVQNQVDQAYRVSAIPCTVIISNGKVQAVEVGVGPGSKKSLRDAIDMALKKADGAGEG